MLLAGGSNGLLYWADVATSPDVVGSVEAHGGAPVTPDCPDRHTLVYRFYGDKLFYRPLPTGGCNYGYDISNLNDPSLTPGEPFRAPYCTQVR
jgi:hypothetical protein